jgi:arylsulfatase A-like enzyme
MERTARILEGLGLATLAWLVLAVVEISVRDQAIDRVAVLGYLPSAALLWSAAFGAVVALVHGAHRLLAARWPRRALLGVGALLSIAGLPFCFALSGSLVEGDWIAGQSWAGALRIGLFVFLELAWLGLWAFYGASRGPRSWRLRALISLAAILALAGVSIALQGPLLAYTALAKHAVFPAWLIAFGLARQLASLAPRVARYAAFAGVASGLLASAHSAWDRDLASFASTELAASSSFVGIAEGMVATPSARLGSLPFEQVRGAPCPEPRQPEPLALRPEQRRNVIWLSIDTVRRDAIGKRFGDRAVAPSLEAFVKKGVFFQRAVSPAAATLPSLSSAVSGFSTSQLFFMRKPPRNIFGRVRAALPEQHIVMPDWKVFRGRPYKKLITQSATVRVPSRKGDPLKPFVEALESAKAAGKRGFFWLHLVAPHSPYAKHAKLNFGASKPARYYGEVAHDDAIVGRALGYLEAQGYFEDSLIVVFSDHGEALGERGDYFGHGIAMRARYTDIPLIVRYPGVTPRVSNAAVSLPSLAATVLHYLGLPLPKTLDDCSLLQSESALARCAPAVSTTYGLNHGFMSRALGSPIASHAELEARWTLIKELQSHVPEVGFTTSTHRYLLNLYTGGERLFDRAKDPAEQQSLVRSERALVGRFRTIAERWAEHEATRIACGLPD